MGNNSWFECIDDLYNTVCVDRSVIFISSKANGVDSEKKSTISREKNETMKLFRI